MELLQYVSKIKQFKKDDLISSIRDEKGILSGLKDTVALIKSSDLDLESAASRWALTQGILKDIHRQLPASVKLMEVIEFNTKSIEGLLNGIEARASKIKQNLIAAESVTIREANLLSLMDGIEHWTKFTDMLLSTLLTMAGNKTNNTNELTKNDLAFLNKTWNYYSFCSVQYFKGHVGILADLDKMPDVPANEQNVDVIVGSKGIGAVSIPMNSLMPHELNPKYWFDNFMVDINLRRIKNLHESNKMLAFKIEQASNKRNGVNDPNIDRQIEIFQDKIIKNNAAVERIRGKYA